MVKNILVLDDGTEIAAGTVGQNAIRSLICTETVSKTCALAQPAPISWKSQSGWNRERIFRSHPGPG